MTHDCFACFALRLRKTIETKEAWQLIEKATGMMRSPELTELAQAPVSLSALNGRVVLLFGTSNFNAGHLDM